MIAYGPVPSRRLGRSLGINNIPPKVCSYACAYCQVGNTLKMSKERRSFYPPARLVDEVHARVEQVRAAGEPIDYLAFVPDGEPTLDVHLGKELRQLKDLGIPLAVISNGSLTVREDVREELMEADWVSLKVDAVETSVWRRVDRPHRALDLEAILEGIQTLVRDHPGQVVTETMLVDGINDGVEQAAATAAFLGALGPASAFLSVPTRPPADRSVRPPTNERLLHWFQALANQGLHVEWLIGSEGNAFTGTGDPATNLMSITAVHPMREEAVQELLERAGAGWALVEELVQSGRLLRMEYQGEVYFLRNPRRPAEGDDPQENG